MKKALALILCLVMLLGVFPMSAAFAEGETEKLPEANAASVGEGEILYLTEGKNTATLQEAQATESVATVNFKSVNADRIENAFYVIVDYAEMVSNKDLLEKVREMVAGGKYVFIRANGMEATRDMIFELLDEHPSLITDYSDSSALNQTFGYIVYKNRFGMQVVADEFEELTLLESEKNQESMEKILSIIEPPSFSQEVESVKLFISNTVANRPEANNTMAAVDINDFTSWPYSTTAQYKTYTYEGEIRGTSSSTGHAIEMDAAYEGSQWIFMVESTINVKEGSSSSKTITNGGVNIVYSNNFKSTSYISYGTHITAVRPTNGSNGSYTISIGNKSFTLPVSMSNATITSSYGDDTATGSTRGEINFSIFPLNPFIYFNGVYKSATYYTAVQVLNQKPTCASVDVSITPIFHVWTLPQNYTPTNPTSSKFSIKAGESKKWTPIFEEIHKGNYTVKGNSVICRSTWSTSGGVVGSYNKGQTIKVLGATGTALNDWAKVQYNSSTTGYVRSDLIDWNTTGSGGGSGGGGSSSATYLYKVNASGGLKLRKTASTSGTVLTTMAEGTMVYVKSISNGWAYVYYKKTGQWGYASVGTKPYLVKTAYIGYNGNMKVTTSGGKLNLRTGPGTGYSSAYQVSNGTTLHVVGYTSSWAYVYYNGGYYYASKTYLK